LSFTIYVNASKDDEKSQQEKVFSEIKFVENKLASLLNAMNNIEARNYSLVTTELSKETTEKSTDNKNETKSESSGESSGEQSSSENSDQSETSQEEQENNKKFELKSNGVLTSTENINWDMVKSEVENLYTSIPSITMDLYKININQEDVLSFNNEYDKLTTVVKDEKKEETLAELTKVYEYLPKFLKSSGQEEVYTTLIETKNDIFKGYSKLDNQNWQEISDDVTSGIDNYSKLLTNTNIDSSKQYSISKVYVMLNELQNAVSLQDTSVFLIKYRNLLEEINNI
jgi:hypothetical protein